MEQSVYCFKRALQLCHGNMNIGFSQAYSQAEAEWQSTRVSSRISYEDESSEENDE